jgi:hypothetical protein
MSFLRTAIFTMIGSFKQQLEAWSFEQLDRRSFFRRIGALWWWIYETPLSKNETEVRVNLGLGIFDPFLEDNGQQLISLSADVEPQGISVHFEETPYWWSESKAEKVRSILEQQALNCFAYWTEDELIRYFQRPVTRLTFDCAQSENVNRPVIDKSPGTRRVPIHQRWLALLCYHKKDYKHSLIHSEAWLETVKHSTSGGDPEPARTLRQIAALRAMLVNEQD